MLGNVHQQPQVVLQLQAQAILALCQRSGEILQIADPQSVLGLFASRSHSDLDWQRVQDGWYELRRVGGALVCKFPTLEK
jgi:hypothetical protein